MFFKYMRNVLGLYFSFLRNCAFQSIPKKKKKDKKTNFATDSKQIIMNNQSKAITSNSEAENNSVQQLRLTVTRARGTVPDKAKMMV